MGSSAISAAFDSAVAFDIDGVQVGRLRMVQSSFMDLQQVDVLKGPQSLYFGKSASAGVISFRSANPTDTFEGSVTGGYDLEFEGPQVQGFVSGPLSDTLGARLAFQYTDAQEIFENTAPPRVGDANGSNTDSIGEEIFNTRLTLAWDPTDRLSINWKTTFTSLESDIAIGPYDILCGSPGNPQQTTFGGSVVDSGYDCDDDDGQVQLGDLGAVHGVNFGGLTDREQFEELDTLLTRVELAYDINDSLSFTWITGYFDLDEEGAGNYSYDLNGFGTGFTRNTTESWSHEFRFEGSVGDSFDYMVGGFYQDRELVFDTSQHAVGAAQLFVLGGAPTGEDPVTGRTDDWQKTHTTDSETTSVFGSFTWRPNELWEITAGARYSDDERSNEIDVPYIHSLFAALGFVPSGFNSGEIEFDDKNFSPEVSVLYALNDEITLLVRKRLTHHLKQVLRQTVRV